MDIVLLLMAAHGKSVLRALYVPQPSERNLRAAGDGPKLRSIQVHCLQQPEKYCQFSTLPVYLYPLACPPLGSSSTLVPFRWARRPSLAKMPLRNRSMRHWINIRGAKSVRCRTQRSALPTQRWGTTEQTSETQILMSIKTSSPKMTTSPPNWMSWATEGTCWGLSVEQIKSVRGRPWRRQLSRTHDSAKRHLPLRARMARSFLWWQVSMWHRTTCSKWQRSIGRVRRLQRGRKRRRVG